MPIGVKYGGRSKGSPNKKTADQISRAERILQLIEKTYFATDIKTLTSSQRMILYSDMLEYVSPKLSRQEVNGNIKHKMSLEIVRTVTQILPKHTPPASAESD